MTESVRPMRADAIRNRAKILDAARAQIEQHGPDAGMEGIAAEAGVAVGTLYRHFPTKVDLVAAVLVQYTQQMTDEAVRALERARSGAVSPLAALVAFLIEVVRVSAQNAAAKAAAPALGAAVEVDGTDAAAALAQLIELGVNDGTVRSDLIVADVYLLVSSAPLDGTEAARTRWTELVLPCLTTESAAITVPR